MAALILSVNPFLTQQQVFNILTNTADRVGGYVYTNGRSNELGSGRLNACNAVREAIRSANLSVGGQDYLCSNGSSSAMYSLVIPANINFTPGAIQWSSSVPTAVSVNSITGQATVISSTFNGLVDIVASIPVACTNIVLTKTIRVNNAVPSVATSDDRTPQPSNYTYHTATATLLPGTVSSNYAWYEEVNGNPTNLITTGLQMNRWPVPPCGAKYYQLRVTHQCGTSVYRGYAYNSYGCGGGFMVVSYPNPADAELTIELKDQQSDQLNTVAIADEYDVKLYNRDVLLVKQGKSKQKSISFSTKDLPNGLYILQVVDKKGNQTRERVIIQR